MTCNDPSEPLFCQTPWQTVGPFFHYALPWKGGADLTGQSECGARSDLVPEGHDFLNLAPDRGPVQGRVIEITGRMLDGEGQPVSDALIEIWQANAAGRYNSFDARREADGLDPNFTGFGRCATADDGGFRFRTVHPGRVPARDGTLQAPHIAVSVFARGILRRLVTRIYFEGSDGLDEDSALALVPEARRKTLIATRGESSAIYRFDIRLQGASETVFFEF